MQTIRGGIYWRNRRLIKPRCSDLKQSLKTVPGPAKDVQHNGPNLRPRRSIRKPERLIESMNQIQAQFRDYNCSPGHFQNFNGFQHRDRHYCTYCMHFISLVDVTKSLVRERGEMLRDDIPTVSFDDLNLAIDNTWHLSNAKTIIQACVNVWIKRHQD